MKLFYFVYPRKNFRQKFPPFAEHHKYMLKWKFRNPRRPFKARYWDWRIWIKNCRIGRTSQRGIRTDEKSVSRESRTDLIFIGCIRKSSDWPMKSVVSIYWLLHYLPTACGALLPVLKLLTFLYCSWMFRVNFWH